MKSNAPWSVKGIEKDARETAKEAARREGMTVGEWLSQVIYTAGDPETSNGEIEGLKISDLVNAIEHLNKRVIGTESKTVTAVDDLARNIGVVVERLQRLERGRPAGEGPAPDIEARLARLEEIGGDRQRIEALKALEKAVGQVALQFDSAQKSALARIEGTERRIESLAQRVEAGALAGSGSGAVEAVGHLKDAIDGMAQRMARVERAATDAVQLTADGAGAAGADFVERTGKRLRVLGDEIKRGGDQIRSLESLVKKLSEQIDQAERRSSEGVQKVAETIAELKTQFSSESADGGSRAEIEAAVAAVTRRTEGRIALLQRSFDQMVSRLDAPGAARPALAPQAAEEDDDAETIFDDFDDADSFDAEEAAPIALGGPPAGELREDAGADDGAFGDADDDAGIDGDEDEEDTDAAFRFDLDEDAPQSSDYAAEILSEVQGAFAGVARRTEAPPAPPADEEEDGGFDSLIAELEGDDEARAETPPAPAAEFAARAVTNESANVVRAARRAAKEAAERSAAHEALKRKLTPKQRVILAAKLRRRRLAQQGLSLDAAALPEARPAAEAEIPAAPATGSPATDAPTEKASRGAAIGPALGARLAGLVAGLKSRLPARKPREDRAAERAPAETGAAPAGAEDDDEFALPAKRAAADPNFLAAARKLPGALRARPVTAALGAAILLAVAALFFLVRDLLNGAPEPAAQSAPTTPAAADASLEGESDAPQLAEIPEPEVPAAPAVPPRALYLESVAKLKTATNDAETAAAIEGLRQAATLGHPPAQLQLGELYKLGQGVPQDAAEARAWYERAATGGNVLAMHRVGVMAARGQGGAASPETAVAWFERASNLGLVDSQYNLGAIFHPGGDAANQSYQDAGQAYYWYSLAARNGDGQAASLAAALGETLSPADRRRLDDAVASWSAETPDPDANEVAPAS